MRTRRWGMPKLSVLGLAIRPRPGGFFFRVFDTIGEPGVTGVWRFRHCRPTTRNGLVMTIARAICVSIQLRHDFLYISAGVKDEN